MRVPPASWAGRFDVSRLSIKPNERRIRSAADRTNPRTPLFFDAVEQLGKASPRLDGVGSGAGTVTNRVLHALQGWLKESQTTNLGAGGSNPSGRAR
jgi:hypothetical protein